MSSERRSGGDGGTEESSNARESITTSVAIGVFERDALNRGIIERS